MTKTEWRKPKTLLVFNRKKTLVMIASSVNEFAKASGLNVGAISKACTGELISGGKYYFRYIDSNIEIEINDIGSLKLEAYDEMCGVKRITYSTIKMNRKNWKYKKKEKH